MTTKYAFRCLGKMADGSDCGHLHTSGHAGEHHHPHSCVVCRGGVEFEVHRLARLLRDPSLTPAQVADIATRILTADPAHKTLYESHWEVLAKATPGRLKELGLTADQVETHVPAIRPLPASSAPPRSVFATVTEGPAAGDEAPDASRKKG
jgi:hypothetical protein